MSDHHHTEPLNVAFHRNSPRPPVPGEERTHAYTDWAAAMDQSATSYGGPIKGANASKAVAELQQHSDSNNAPSAACLRWAISLHCLLQDPDGVQLFKRFLLGEGHADILDFWFACEGLKKQSEPDKVYQISKAIYKRYFLKLNLPITEEIKRELGRALRSAGSSSSQYAALFDEAQLQIEHLINDTTYPNFIKSDIYLQYVEQIQNALIVSASGETTESSTSSSSTSSNKDAAGLTTNAAQLPTIHEDKELSLSLLNSMISLQSSVVGGGYVTPPLTGSPGAVRLTKDSLLATQKNRALDVRPQSETFAADMYLYRNSALHLPYNSYNPVSRQDSEMQSISSHSDARTESDTMSLTDSSVDGRSAKRSLRRKAVIEARHARESAELNKETHLHQTLIPRTQLMEKQQCQPLRPDEFAAILIHKLECVKRDLDKHEILERKLCESNESSAAPSSLQQQPPLSEAAVLSQGGGKSSGDLQTRELANAIREKLLAEDDNCQHILDEHVSIVFSDNTSHALSPGEHSPLAMLPPTCRTGSSSSSNWPRSQGLRPAFRRKERDGFSTFSGDSGNVHDFVDTVENTAAKMVKSRSMPDYVVEDKFSRGTTLRRSSSKKAPTEFTDSGVSVVSDTPPDHRVLAWLMDSEQRGGGGGGGSRSSANSHTCHSDATSGSKHRSHRETSSATSPNVSRHRKAFGSRSDSLERSGVATSLCPAQPFVADPSMPPLPQPNTAVQLEEARRRLMEDDIRLRTRQQRVPSKHFPEQVTSYSSHSTLRKSNRNNTTAGGGQRVSASESSEELTTTVVFSFCDEEFPYRTKIPGKQITLKQFKEYLPKKGNYRFFFKTECEELDNQVIQEEVSNDHDVLPLWEGRINAQVKPID